MRVLRMVCDRCGAEAITDGAWPAGWYHWHKEDLCHVCAVPLIQQAIDDDSLVPPLPMRGIH